MTPWPEGTVERVALALYHHEAGPDAWPLVRETYLARARVALQAAAQAPGPPITAPPAATTTAGSSSR